MRQWAAKLNRIAVAVLMMPLLASVLPAAPVLAMGGPTLNGSDSLSAAYGATIAVTDLQISDTGNPTEQVRLVVSAGSLSMTTTTGLTFTGGTSGAQVKFSGTLSDVNAALATLHYTRTSGIGSDTLEVSLVGANQVYDPTNGHLYEYVTSDGSKTWTQAKVLADARTDSGAAGYLATMTSSEENTFISDRLTGAGWMGAGDSAAEGAWKWVDGPETGTQFWSGRAANYFTPGSPVGGQYNDWNTGEPNDSGGNEDCGQFLSGAGGQWNDLPCTVTTLPGYVTEYGAPGNLPQIPSKNVALAITGATHSVSSCSQLQTYGADTATRYDTFKLTSDIDCTGIDFAPLYQADGFHGTLNGQGHKITNLTIDHPSDHDVGLFSKLVDATVDNLTLDSGFVTGDYFVGALAGEASDNITISNVISHLNVDSVYYTGGLLGNLVISTVGATASVTGSSSTGNVTTTDGYSGGLIGYIVATDGSVTLSQVFATGNVVSNNDDIGGLVGYVQVSNSTQNSAVTIQDAYARGNVTDPSYQKVGGLIGVIVANNGGSFTSTATILRTYASGAATGSQNVGGLIGMMEWQSNAFDIINVQDSFAAGHVTSTDPSFGAGLVGFYNEGPQVANFTNNYFDVTRTAQTDCGGGHPVPNCTGVNVASAEPSYFKNNSSNAPMNNWDFSTIWVANAADYPTFVPADDGDNVPSADEDAAPNAGDANGDGVKDSIQADVASLYDPVDGHYAVLQSSCGNLFNVRVGGESATAGQTDVAYSYPGGLLGFVVTGCTPGATATITQYFYGLTTPEQYVMRKWNSASNTYTTVPGANFSMVTIGGQSVLMAVYRVTDGSTLDQDGLTDGNIDDPAGPAVNVLGVPNTGGGALSRR